MLNDLELRFNRPGSENEKPDEFSRIDPDELKDVDIQRDIDIALREIDDELEQYVRRDLEDPGERRRIFDAIRDIFNRDWPDIPGNVRNIINNARSRWGGARMNRNRLIGIIGTLIGTGLVTGATLTGTGTTTISDPVPPPPPGPEKPTDDPFPPGPDPPMPPEEEKCVKICDMPKDDDECPPQPPSVPGEHGEHPEEMQLGDTFGLSPATYLNSRQVNRKSPYAPQQGLSFDSGEYDMNNPLIRSNMMNDAIRYGGKLFMPEMPLPPPPKLTRGYVNARAPENINELVTEKPKPNTGVDLHAPFNRAFQEFDIATGKVVNDFMKAQIARLSFAC
jgi:hypothetical protein